MGSASMTVPIVSVPAFEHDEDVTLQALVGAALVP